MRWKSRTEFVPGLALRTELTVESEDSFFDKISKVSAAAAFSYTLGLRIAAGFTDFPHLDFEGEFSAGQRMIEIGNNCLIIDKLYHCRQFLTFPGLK